MPINMTMRYTPENLQRAFTLHYRKTNWWRGNILLLLGVLLVWTGLMLWLVYRNQDQRVIQYVYMACGALLVGVHYVLMQRLGAMTFKRLGRPHGTFEFRIGEERIEMVTEKGIYSVDWDRVLQAVMQPDIVLIYIGKQQFYFFPSQNFTDPNDFRALQQLVTEKSPKVIG
jgi:hypothetical protein